MCTKNLTVAITTYNRKEALIAQLRSLECQGLYDKYQIKIFNNCSNYDVEGALKSALSAEFMDIITVCNRKYNVGGDCNIALSFLQVDTPWMWLLSDDDVTMPTSLSTVLEDMEKYSDVCWLKYSIDGFAKFQDKKVDNLVELFDSFRTEGHMWGEFVFMSNNVYNLSNLEKVRGNILYWTMTCFSQIMGPLMAIKNDKQVMAFRSVPLTNYEAGRISYKLHYAYLNFPHMLNASFELSAKELSAFHKMFRIGVLELVLSLFEVENSAMRYEFYKQYKIFYLSENIFKRIEYVMAFQILHRLNFTHEKIRKLKSLVKSVCIWKH